MKQHGGPLHNPCGLLNIPTSSAILFVCSLLMLTGHHVFSQNTCPCQESGRTMNCGKLPDGTLPQCFHDLASSGVRNIFLNGKGLYKLESNTFSNFQSVEKLFLHNNRLTALRENVFHGLSRLNILFLSKNHLTALPGNVFQGLSSLTTLAINDNQLTSLPPGIFDKMQSLSTLYLSQNNLTTWRENVFQGLTGLKHLFISENPWHCSGPVCQMAQAQVVDAPKCATPNVLKGRTIKGICVKPKFILGAQVFERLEFSNVTFGFSVESPVPLNPLTDAITWRNPEGKTITNSSKYVLAADHRKLLVNNLTRNDDGQYRVTAQNIAGHATTSFNLSVYVLPKIVSPPDGFWYSINESDTFTSLCQATAFPLPTVQWTTNNNTKVQLGTERIGMVVVNDTVLLASGHLARQNSTLKVANVDYNDTGDYTCRASISVLGQTFTTSRSVRLIVQIAPHFLEKLGNTSVTEGAKVNLTCQVFSVPAPTFKWTSVPNLSDVETKTLAPPLYTTNIHFQGTVLSNGTNVYTYTCSAGNNVTTAVSMGKVTILVPTSLNFSSMQNLTVVENSTARFSCRLRGYPRPTITWNAEKFVNFTMESVIAPTETHPHQYISHLFIDHVKKEMESFYTCNGSNGIGSDAQRFFLKVQVPPVATITTPSKTATQGKSVKLYCDAEGTKPITFLWYNKHKAELSSGLEYTVNILTGVLTIMSANYSRDHGHLYCAAINNNIVDEKQRRNTATTTLDVLVKLSLTTGLQVFERLEFSNVTFSFSIQSPVNPTPMKENITWTNPEGVDISNSSKFVISADHRSLMVHNVTRNDDGVYSVNVQNSGGHGSTQFNLSVYVLPKIVSPPDGFWYSINESDTFTSLCQATAFPLPTVQWTTNNNTKFQFGTERIGMTVVNDTVLSASGHLARQNSTLKLANVDYNDTGDYTCRASISVLGQTFTASRSVRLIVQIAPHFLEKVTNTSVTEGAKVTLTCQVFAVPAPTFKWTSVPNVSVVESKTSAPPLYTTNIHFQATVLSNGTNVYTYTCSAGNNVTTAVSTGKVTILIPTSLNFSSMQNLTVVENSTAKFSCRFRGYPRPAITWNTEKLVNFTTELVSAPAETHPHQYISALFIDHVKKEMESFYTCIGSNGIGSDVRRFFLKVQATCLTEWLRRAGIPADYVRSYQESLETAHFNTDLLRKLNVYGLAWGFFKGNIGHASKLKKCLARETQRCKTFNPCGKGGRCNFSKKRSINVCSCRKGRQGDFCKKDVDECSVGLSRCHANATCANTKGSYQCTCKVGFRGNGWKCTEICECCSSPCQHGGSCIEKINAYSCHCSVGYEGTHCQTQWLHAHKHKSLPEVVTNLTKAVQKLTEKMVNLEKDRGRCDGSPCVGGRCVTTGRSYMCICQWNYYGKRCENKCPSGTSFRKRQQKCVCFRGGEILLRGVCTAVPIPKECVSYSTLSKSWRHYKRHRGNQAHCDSGYGFTPGWYRFTGAAGSKMPTGCGAVKKHHCGAHTPVYMRGQHPVLADGVVTRTVCGKYDRRCCHWSPWSIKVRMCPGNFYVYYLPRTPGCSATYCGSD